MCTPVCYDSEKVHSRGMTMDSFSPFFIKMELENDVHRGRDYLIGHVLPSRPSDESLSVVEVEVPVLSMVAKTRGLLADDICCDAHCGGYVCWVSIAFL